MGTTSDQLLAYAAILGSTGITLGAFGAHALKDTLTRKPGAMENWRTAVMYQLVQATALLGMAALAAVNNNVDQQQARLLRAGQCMALGSSLFSGSIYCLCLEYGPKKLLGPTTPIGGLFMIGGWVLVGLAGSGGKEKL